MVTPNFDKMKVRMTTFLFRRISIRRISIRKISICKIIIRKNIVVVMILLLGKEEG